MEFPVPLTTCARLYFHEVGFYYQSAAGRSYLINAASFKLGAGECVVVVGANGVGKSTFLRLAAGGLSPIRGRIVRAASGGSVRVGYLHQDFSHINEALPVTVEQVVFLGRAASRRYSILTYFLGYNHLDSKIVEFFLTVFDLAGKRKQCFSSLSGGQKRKVLLAQIFSSAASLLVLDEPTTYLDKKSKETTLELLYRQKKQRSILITAHDYASYFEVADRVIFLRDGKLEEVGREQLLRGFDF